MSETGATWKIRSVSQPVALVSLVAHFTRLVSPPSAATASHPIQWKRLIACF